MYNMCMFGTSMMAGLMTDISYMCLALFLALLINYGIVQKQTIVGKNEKTEMMFNQKTRRGKIEVRTEFDHQSKIYDPPER